MKKISCLVAVFLVLGLCACGNQEVSVSSVDSAMNSASQKEGLTSSTETEDNSFAGGDDSTVDYDEIRKENNDSAEAFVSIVKIKINPEMDLYLDLSKNIIRVECINDDARKIAESISDSGEVLLGRPFLTGLEIILTSSVDSGYLKENADVNISLDEISINYEADYEKVLEGVDDVVQNVISDQNINFNCNVACEGYRVFDDSSSNHDLGHESDHKSNKNENTICDECNGTGTIVMIEKFTANVYNGTPCQICGDVGTVDDGMHGGERAECGECRGYGANHSVGDVDDGSGGFNGDYREYAFDEKTIEEERNETCPTCGGRGS